MLALCCVWAFTLGAGPAFAGEWVAGDLHVHTTYSHDSYGGPGDDNTGLDDANTAGVSVGGQFALAKSHGCQAAGSTPSSRNRASSASMRSVSS